MPPPPPNTAEAPPPPPTQDTPPAPAPNTIFTEDAATKARELLRRKLGQLNSGLDPEMLQAGITLAGYHIEKGARSFSAYAQAMLADLGDAVRPYLKSWYMGVKYDPRAAGFDGMDAAAVVEAADPNTITTEVQDAPSTDGGAKVAEKPVTPSAVTLKGPRRDPTTVSMFNPYYVGDVVTIAGQDWQIQQDMPGWYLTNTGNWRGTHPTIQRIRSMADLIREIERASTEKEAPKNEKPAPAESPKVEAKPDSKPFALSDLDAIQASLRDGTASNAAAAQNEARVAPLAQFAYACAQRAGMEG